MEGFKTFIKKHLRAVVYGGTDGIITTFAVVSGVNGASLSLGVLLILGLATVLADAISMSVSDYMSTMADLDVKKLNATEAEKDIEGSESEMKSKLEHTFVSRNFSKRESEQLSAILIKDKVLVAHVLEEFEDTSEEEIFKSALTSGATTFSAFVLFGLVPLLSTITIPLYSPFFSSCVWTALTLMALGYFKAKLTHQKPWASAMQMLALGGGSSAIAYFISSALSQIIDSKPA